ncbi:MAG: hypothetical protein EOO67_16180 [Microbacterium sp.]|nr:MAG: hypothetical protein EOO67_16180 [Microbacterium sp.]
MTEIDEGWFFWSLLTLPLSGVLVFVLLLCATDDQYAPNARRALVCLAGIVLLWSVPGLYVLLL